VNKVTKSQVRSSFKSIREIMRYVESELKNIDKLDAVDLKESSNVGQLALELRAEAGVFLEYVDYLHDIKRQD
jgi:hypothetical protein